MTHRGLRWGAAGALLVLFCTLFMSWN